ncbi:MAG: hypothetical protein OEY25_02680 [Candidatus Aminicenantes bacterium]|nr:hypothetical protein [Candidatus Aminicenantes bacterium]MDH5466303.1 hypothetical protein [Candidatus Aminicenantes bacterium]MDH5707195.1 hypothetical protein [Candidatus Aminicenantes bacterium]
MKKAASFLSLLALFLGFFSGISLCQQVDLSGTWVGETEVPDAFEPDKVTLVLEKINGEYKGTVTDSMGMAQEAELENLEIKGNELKANFIIFDGYEYTRIYFVLTVEGDKMKGSWESESGDSAPIELQRQK